MFQELSSHLRVALLFFLLNFKRDVLKSNKLGEINPSPCKCIKENVQEMSLRKIFFIRR